MDLNNREKPFPVESTWWFKFTAGLRVNKKLVPLKLLVLLMNGANNALYPYFTLHMLAVGLTLTESGIIFVLIPIVGCVGSPVAGFLADKLGDYKKVVITLILLSIISHALLGFAVPRYSSKTERNSREIGHSEASVEISCSSVVIQVHENSTKAKDFQTKSVMLSNDTELVLGRCEHPDNTSKYSTLCFKAHLSEHCINPKIFARASLKLQNGSNRSLFVGGYHRLPVNQLIIPTIGVVSVSSFVCKGSHNVLQECRIANNFSVQEETKTFSGNRMLTFTLYILFRVIGATCVSSTMQLLDASTLLMAKQHKGDFGIQRTFGLIGSVLMPPLSGYLIDVASKNSGYQDYSPAFYLFCGMYFLGAVLTCYMSLEVKSPAKQIWKAIGKMMRIPKIASFIVVMFVVGCCFGALENYLFWFMQKFLQSPKWLLGMTNTVASLSAIPVVAASTFIIKLFGHAKIFMMSIIVYGIRFLAYSFVYDAYLILPVEILEALTFSLCWVTATVYCGKIADASYLATLQGLIGSLHYSVGRGSGALVAGMLFDHFEARLVYQSMAYVCFISGTIYALIHYTWLRNTANPKERTGRSPGARENSENKTAETVQFLDNSADLTEK